MEWYCKYMEYVIRLLRFVWMVGTVLVILPVIFKKASKLFETFTFFDRNKFRENSCTIWRKWKMTSWAKLYRKKWSDTGISKCTNYVKGNTVFTYDTVTLSVFQIYLNTCAKLNVCRICSYFLKKKKQFQLEATTYNILCIDMTPFQRIDWFL